MDTAAQLFKALAEPVRLKIIAMLLEGERCVCELMAGLDMPQSTVSRHLAYLKNTGWVSGERRGVWSYYRLAEPASPLHRDLLAVLAARLPEMVSLPDAEGLRLVRPVNRC